METIFVDNLKRKAVGCMVLVFIALLVLAIAVSAYFVVKNKQDNEDSLTKIKFKEISLGTFEDNNRRLAKKNISYDSHRRKLIKALKNSYKSIV